MEAISGRKTIQEIAADHAIQVSQWKRQLLDGASELFTRGKQSKDKEEVQAKEAELFRQIGRLQMELGWLKKNLSCSDAHELRKLVYHDHPELSVSRQCVLLSLARSTLYYRPVPVRESALRIMARIDAVYLEDPCSGSRRIVAYLVREGIPISRDRVRNLMREWVYGRSTRNHAPPFQVIHPRDFRAWWISGRSRRWIKPGPPTSLHPVAERISLPGGDRVSRVNQVERWRQSG